MGNFSERFADIKEHYTTVYSHSKLNWSFCQKDKNKSNQVGLAQFIPDKSIQAVPAKQCILFLNAYKLTA